MTSQQGGCRSNRVIVLVEEVDLRAMAAMNVARSLSENVLAFSVVADDIAKSDLYTRWNQHYPDTPFVVEVSPQLGIVKPLLALIETYVGGDADDHKTTVILTETVLQNRWHRFLHNHTAAYVMRQLVRHKHIDVLVIPVRPGDDGAMAE